MNRRFAWLGLMTVAVGLAVDAPRPVPEVGRSYKVPYRMTDTNHFLVRVRIDGKGPFNFLVDTGAPHIFVGAEAARKSGIVADPEEYFTSIGRVDFEGGAHLDGMKARIEDIFQMVGMNALGLPGASIDGILGFSALARFKIELDPTQDRMTWTRLDYEPKEPFVPRAALKKMQANQPAEMKAMNALGPIAKFAAAMLGKQPEEELHPRGFLGIELAEDAGKLRVSGLLADSPAAAGGLKAGDLLTKVKGQAVDTLKAALEAVAEVRPGDEVVLTLERDGETLKRTLTAGEGL
ncbi:PDZ domain-containing protein [Tundrisphaera lichenicola]|uniref:PDZ domain-containing protein n=1 Tax=Tundrisphaera lichenicola TaxID=2029860 RepID=UPI003EBB012D